jgi:hypothetical protein
MFTKQEQRFWAKRKFHEVVEHKTVIKDNQKHVMMLLCHIAQWHDGWNCSVGQNDLIVTTIQFSAFRLCWMSIDDGLRGTWLPM